jgi:hypothetical protein
LLHWAEAKFPLRFIFVLVILERKQSIQNLEGELRWLTEEASDGRRMAGKGTAKKRGRRLLHFRTATIPKKFTSSKMDGWFMSDRMAELMFSTRILIIPAFERQDTNGEEESKRDIGGGFIKILNF